jgi:glycosyltransferase involved in cell wall biosynthesis
MERSMLRLALGLKGRGHAVEFVVKKRRGELADQVPSDIPVYETGERWMYSQSRPTPKAATKIGKILRRIRKWPRKTEKLVKISILRIYLLRSDPLAWRLLLTRNLRALRALDRLEALPGLARYLRRQRPDAVLAAEPHYNTMAVLARRLADVPTLVVVSERVQPSMRERRHGPWRHPYLKEFLRRSYLSADKIVAVSDGVADDLSACSGISREQIKTIYNPIVGPDLTLMSEEPLNEPIFDVGAPPVILAVGRFDPQKDYLTLVHAFARLRRRRRARLLILGAESQAYPLYPKEIHDLAVKLGVAEDVILPGYKDNPFAYMARARVLVLSSTHEGLPGVLIQALACGCPVVSTDCPSGPKEILDGGRFGALIPVGDVAALADAINTTLDKPLASAVLKARAEKFSVDRAVDSYLRLLMGPDGEAEQKLERQGDKIAMEA